MSRASFLAAVSWLFMSRLVQQYSCCCAAEVAIDEHGIMSVRPEFLGMVAT